jgi:uncharacterized protein YceK
MRRSKIVLVFVCLALTGVGAVATDIKPKPSHLTKDKPFSVYWYYWCASGLDGRQLLDCPFTHRVLGLKSPATDPENNGGHSHGPTGRPFVLNNGQLEHPADSHPDPLVVESSTLATGGFAPIKHDMPEVSGTFQVEGILRLPPNWFCWGPAAIPRHRSAG